MSEAYNILLYLGVGTVFSGLFEYLMYKTGYKEPTDNKNWERLFWITCWPYLLLKFLIAYFKR
jgi:hypothetical protein|tara:strand:- start:1823 stop:2011 length:189 start_codon:yes stop_codon:yes gene_type:complete